MSVWGALEGLDRTVSGRTAAKLMKSAVSDGGEDQGAEEAFHGVMPRENRFRPFWEAVSRVSERLSFQRAQVLPALV